MNKSDLMDIIAKKTSTKKDATAAIDELFESMKEALAKGERVQIAGFGSFSVKERQARMGRNPRTGEAVEIPARKVVKFKGAKEII